MSLFTLDNGNIELVVSSQGGCVLKCVVHGPAGDIPLLRPSVVSETTPVLQSGCFPLVPFGNRVNDNHFNFEGQEYQLTANTDWDRHYLHGDGWLSDWQCVEQRGDFLRLRFQHSDGPYQYRAEQYFTLVDSRVCIELEVEHQGDRPMPYGLGWHPYFPLTPQTQLCAQADAYWLEADEWLAGERVGLTEELDFRQANSLPRRWVNNGFDGWDGKATIDWPERELRLVMQTVPACPVYFIFVSDPAFDAGYQFEFFCLEPMSHAANGHSMVRLGGLQRLMAGESLKQQMWLGFSPLCGGTRVSIPL